MNDTQLSDGALFQSIRQRDADAFETLYDRHAPTVYNFIFRVVPEAGQAEVILVDTFWEVWQTTQSSTEEQPSIGWLYRIARTRSVDYLRHLRALVT